jgi:DNA gyrase/topoisomerase IV subunit B
MFRANPSRLKGVTAAPRGTGLTATAQVTRNATLSAQILAGGSHFSTSTLTRKTAVPPVDPEADAARSAQYEKKTPIEHVLLRPGMYIGSSSLTNPHDSWCFVAEAKASGAALGGHMELRRDHVHNPGLLKLFDEILVNACDNAVRTWSDSAANLAGSTKRKPTKAEAGGAGGLKRMRVLSVVIDPGSDKDKRRASISLFNDGRGIPIVLHQKEGCYVPELVFGHLLTGSNFADPSKDNVGASSSSSLAAATGGRHGYGAKLTNIFSHQFTVKTADSTSNKVYQQTWKNNMSVCEPPTVVEQGTTEASKIVPNAAITATTQDLLKDFTEITFTPDLSRFEGPPATTIAAATTKGGERYELDRGTLEAMVRRVVDAAGTLSRFGGSAAGGASAAGGGVTVFLNGKAIPVNSWSDYSRLYSTSPILDTKPLKGLDSAVVASASGKTTAAPAAAGGGDGEASTSTANAPTTTSSSNKATVAASMLSNASIGLSKQLTTTTVDIDGFQWEVTVGAANYPMPPHTVCHSHPPLETARHLLEPYNTPSVVSFVNNISTSRGGTHAAVVVDALVKALQPLIEKKAHASASSSSDDSSELVITPHLIKQHLRVFINAWVRGPSFDSQSKEALSTPIPLPSGTASGTPAKLFPDKFIRSLMDDLGIASLVIDAARAKANADDARTLKRSTRVSETKIKSIPKLEDANYAGHPKKSHECTLIVTEGDSAKALAVAGLAVVGRDRYGVFPLRGKLLNVRDLSPKEALTNHEVSSLITILGLDFNKSYAGVSPSERPLRYGRLMIMADQDVDGSHIKGLLLNMIHTYWPELLKTPASTSTAVDGGGAATGSDEEGFASSSSFLQSFITPIIKARRATGGVVREFFSLKDYEAWRNDKDGEASKHRWSIKYYKGLGTSTSAEGREYFSAMSKHVVPFTYKSDDDSSRLELAFGQSKGKADERKKWLLSQSADSELDSGGVGADGTDGAAFDDGSEEVVPTTGKAAAPESPSQPAAAAPTTPAVQPLAQPPPLLASFGDPLFDGLACSFPAPVVGGATTAATAVEPRPAPAAPPAKAPGGAKGSKAAASAPSAPVKPVTPTATTTPTSPTNAGSQGQAQGVGLSYGTFVDKELIEFSKADLIRSIPSAVDGLKPSQRKVLYACFRRAGGSGGGGARGAASGTTDASAASSSTIASADGNADAGDAGEDTEAESESGNSNADSSKKTAGTAPIRGGSSTVLPPPSSLGSEIKVAQLAGYVAETTAYHHGEASLTATIVGMAQDFVGSNNIPLLQPIGQFGTRLQGGKDAASARYIYTRLSPLARLLFPAGDDPLLRLREDDGSKVEPLLFVPIIPLLLVNGGQGIGTGWSTSVPPHHPVSVIEAVLERLAAGRASTSAAGGSSGISGGILRPWWHRFNGPVYPQTTAAAAAEVFVVEGKAEWHDPNASSNAGRGSGSGSTAKKSKGSTAAAKGGKRKQKGATEADQSDTDEGGEGGDSLASPDEPTGVVRISELPIGKWTEDYKAWLTQDLLARGSIKSVREYHTESKAEFVVTLTPQGMAEVEAVTVPASASSTATAAAGSLSGHNLRDHERTIAREQWRHRLLSYFKLRTTASLKNMHAFDSRGRIKRYGNAMDVIEEFLPVRRALYHARQAREEALLKAQVKQHDAVSSFLSSVVKGELTVGGKSKGQLVEELLRRDLPLQLAADSALAFDSASSTSSSASKLAASSALIKPASHLIEPSSLTPGPYFYRPSEVQHGDGSSSSHGGLPKGTSYDYLLSLPLWRLTRDAMNKTINDAASARQSLQALQSRKAEDVWSSELQRLKHGLEAYGMNLK